MDEFDITDARDEESVVGNKGFSSSIPIGSVVELFGDRDFRGVVTAVTFRLNRPAQYCVEWRDGRSVTERWLTLGEIQAYARLED